jgi:hypothetical protein
MFLCTVLGELDVSILVCGTTFSLSDTDQIASIFQKKDRIVHVTDFPVNDSEDVCTV